MTTTTHAVEKFYLRPTVHSPNSPLPVLLYRSVLPRPCTEESVKKFLEANNWERRGTWGHIARPHFHPNTHECYGIFQGSSTLKIGRSNDDETGGVLIPVNTGDVIVLPAGTTHSSLDSHGDYRYVGVYPRQAPLWRSVYDSGPIDLQTYRKETSAVDMPDQDPVYGADGPLVDLWKEAARSSTKEITAKL